MENDLKYIGKDVIHYGCGLELNPDTAIKKIAYSARKNIRKAEKAGFLVERKNGTPDELNELRKIWYFPDDPNFPAELSNNDYFYAAYLNGELVGGIILLPVGSHLFLNNLTANGIGKAYQVQGYLLWYVVNELRNSRFRYIDIGVSYRPNLYRFFNKWATFHYPIIFNPPVIKPQIRFTPFQTPMKLNDVKISEERVSDFCLKRPYTILPDIRYAKWIMQDKQTSYVQVPIPMSDLEKVQIVDLTSLLPIQYGALIMGIDIPTQELWDRYGCYDFVKTELIKKVLSSEHAEVEDIFQSRRRVYEDYLHYFQYEDIEIQEPHGFYRYFSISTKDAAKLAKRYYQFGVEIVHQDNQIRFPCHQNLAHEHVEYIYAIYRGYLNLCSEWLPTYVKGALKQSDRAE